jgi:histidine triad (HIT) family protein
VSPLREQRMTVPLSVEAPRPETDDERQQGYVGTFAQPRAKLPRRPRVEDLTVWRESPEASCVFCLRIAGVRWEDGRPVPTAPETPIVEDWPETQAFRPLTPVTPLHTLVVPKGHVPNHTHGAVLAQTMLRAAELARGYEYAGYGSNLIVSSGRAATQSVDHLHVHVVPRTADDGLMVPWGTLSTEDPTAPHECLPLQAARREIVALRDVHDDESRFEYRVSRLLGMTHDDFAAFRDEHELDPSPEAAQDAIAARLRERLDQGKQG